MKNYALACALCACIAVSGTLLSGQLLERVRESAAYRHSKILSGLFKGGDIGWGAAVLDPGARGTLLKFTGALADAYVHFELIPVGELETLGAVYASLTPAVQIDSFAYERRNLTITGRAQGDAAYREFLGNLRGRGHFAQVTGDSKACAQGVTCFEITCVLYAGAIIQMPPNIHLGMKNPMYFNNLGILIDYVKH